MISGGLLLVLSVLIFIAILVTKVGSRFGVPSLLLFLLLGMLGGEDGLGFQFASYETAESLCHFAVTIILFDAGLKTSLRETHPVFRQGVLLSSLGVILTVLLTGLFIAVAFGGDQKMPLIGALLLAAILGSTDSATVFSLLHGKRLHLREHLAPMLELESGSNDAMAYSLTLILVDLFVKLTGGEIGSGQALLTGVGLLLFQLVVGAAAGIGIGYGFRWLLGRISLPGGALNAILILSVALFANATASLLHANSLIAVYIAAIQIGNKVRLSNRKETLNFFGAMAWLMQLMMFMLLGLLARPSLMLPVVLPALLIGVFLIFIARPAAVLLTLLPFRKMSFRAKLLTSWVGIKGAGPILFALSPVVEGLEGASYIFNVVFVLVLFSLILQGTTLRPVAKALRLSYDEDPQTETFGMDVPEEMGMLRDHTVTEEDIARGATLRDLSLPHGIRVMMVRRGERFLVPHGSMPLEVGDRLIIIMGESDD